MFQRNAHMTTTVSKKAKKEEKKRGGKENLLKNKTAFVKSAISQLKNIGTQKELFFNDDFNILSIFSIWSQLTLFHAWGGVGQ